MLDIDDNTIESQSESYLSPDESILRLRIAIIKQAANDYKNGMASNNKKMISDCEKFFNSEWCNFLLPGLMDGITIMNRIKRMLKKI